MEGRHFVRDVRLRDFGFCADDTLRECRLGQEKRARDFSGGQAAKRAQRERDLRFGVNGGMAASEDEAQAVVGIVH